MTDERAADPDHDRIDGRLRYEVMTAIEPESREEGRMLEMGKRPTSLESLEPRTRAVSSAPVLSWLTGIQVYSYLASMKATIQIPDDLYRRVKAAAALRGRTIREVTTELYRRWLGEEEGAGMKQNPTEWLRDWLSAADEAIDRAPPGRSAREELAADRSRLERR